MPMITDIADFFTRGCGRCDRFDTPDCSTRRWTDGLNKLREACRATGLSFGQTMRLVILPQALRIVIPPMGNQYLNIVKNTSIASLIGFVELARAGQLVNNATFQPFRVFLVVAALYFVICYPLSQLSRWLEGRLHAGSRR